MILLVLVALVVVTITCMVAIPVHFSIDTDEGLYLIRQPGFFLIRFIPGKNFGVETRIAGIKVNVKGTPNEPPKKRVSRQGKRYSLSAWMFLVERIFRSFETKRFEMDIDTTDFALNAQLIPIAYFASRQPYSININFTGRNYLRVLITVRPIKLIWAYLLFLTKK